MEGSKLSTKTRHAHQVTALAVGKLQEDAYISSFAHNNVFGVNEKLLTQHILGPVIK